MAGQFNIRAPGNKLDPNPTKQLRQEVAKLLERQNLSFPGAQPVSFARKHIEELTRQNYYVCEKSDGLRYLLYCTRDDDNGKEVHYLIDRKNDYWYVPNLHFPVPRDERFSGFHIQTIIDGELVLDTTGPGQVQAKYLVFDCLLLDGNSLMNRPLDKRIAFFRDFMIKPYENLLKAYPEEIPYMPFVIEMKQMQFAYGIEMMFRKILPELPHGNDGLIFTCVQSDYHFGTDPHILKWKPEAENSVDFRMSLEFPLIQPDTVDIAEGITKPYRDYDALPAVSLLVTVENGKDNYYGSMFLEPSEWEQWKSLNEPLDDRIVECFMDAQKRWRFMRWRDDKDKPNFITTVESVIESITDRVTEKELIVAAKKIRDEWKKREREALKANAAAGGSAAGGSNGNTAAGAKRKASEQVS